MRGEAAKTERLRVRARTNWRLIAAFLALAVASSVGLALGISTRTEVRRLGNPCGAIKKGPHKGEPSKGCYRQAELIFEACRRRPAVCSRSSSVGPLGRGQAALLQALRAQRRAEARARRRAEARRRGSGPSHPPRGSRPGRPPSGQTPTGGSPPGGQQPQPGQNPPPERRTPRQEVEHIVQHPGEVVTNPGGTVHDLGCSLDERLCGLPVVPPPVP